MRRMLVLVMCAGLSLMAPATAEARPRDVTHVTASRSASTPSAPRSLLTAGVERRGHRPAVRVSWKAPVGASSSKVQSYRVRVTPGRGLQHSGRFVVPASKLQVTVKHLERGRTYTVTVRAVNKAGRGPAASTTYTVPRSYVFAVDTATSSIVRVPVAGGRARVVAPEKTAWAVDAAGDVYVVDQDAKTLTRYPVDGSPGRTIGSGFANPTDVQVDAAGYVYVVDVPRVVRLSPTGKAQKVVAQPLSASVFVRADGVVTSTAGDGSSTPLQILTFPAGGGPVQKRTLEGQGEYGLFFPSRGELIGDAVGNLYLHYYSDGASGFRRWFRLAAGSTTLTDTYTHYAYYAAAVDPASNFYLAETATFCSRPAENEGVCTPDRTVDAFLRYAADGTRTSIAITPFTLAESSARAVSTLAADTQGRLFVAEVDGPSAGLLEYPAKGGAAKVLATGTFTEAKRNN